MTQTLIPIFSGKTVNEELIVLYQGNDGNYHLRCPNGKIVALTPGSDVVLWDNEHNFTMSLTVRSPEWIGQAVGSRRELTSMENDF